MARRQAGLDDANLDAGTAPPQTVINKNKTLILMIGFAPVSVAIAGPPFVTDDPEPVDYGHWEVYGYTQGTHGHDDSAGSLPATEANYGAFPGVQLHIAASLAFDRSDGHTRSGPGDTELGAKLRFIEEDGQGWRPMVSFFPMLDLPTGSAGHSLGSGHLHGFLPVWAQKSWGSWTSYGGGGYDINPGDGNRNYWLAGWLLQRKLTDTFTFGGELFHRSADTAGGSDSSGFNLGGSYDLSARDHLLASVGRGFQNAGSTNEFSWYFGYQWTW